MDYKVPDSIASQIQSIPSFKTDAARIKNVGSVKRMYGIGGDERILSYRVVPKLFAKLETGGTIFTDKGVYCKLPSGYLSSDYFTRGIRYSEMIKYIPALGYSADRQPQLIGVWSALENLSFWLTPVAGTESNEAIVNVFDAILDDITSSDLTLFDMHHTVLESFLEEEAAHFVESGKIEAGNERILRFHIERGRLNIEQYITALILIFRNEMRKKNYEDGVQYVIDEGMSLCLHGFDAKLESAMRDEALFIGTPDNGTAVEALELFSRTIPNLTLELFPKIYAYYSQNSLYFDIDEFIKTMESTDVHESVEEELKKALLSRIQDLSVERQSEKLTPNDLAFLLFAAKKPYSSFIASQLLIDHYCTCLLFEEANNVIEEFNKESQDEEKTKSLKDHLEKSKIEFAIEKYNQAEECMKMGDVEHALENYKIAVEVNPSNFLYKLYYIRAILDHKDYSLAHEKILELRAQNSQLETEEEIKLQTMMIQCARGLTEAVRPYYNQLLNNDYNSLFTDDSVYHVKDQLGLSILHYAVMLNEYNAIFKYSEAYSSKEISVCGFDIRCFASNDDNYNYTMMALLIRLDDDAKRIVKRQGYREIRNEVAKAGIGVVKFFINATADELDHQARKLDRMQESSQYSDYYDDIQSKRENISETAVNVRGLDSVIQGASEDNDRSMDEMMNALGDLSKKNIAEFAEIRDTSLDQSSIRSSLIYLLMTDPSLLSLVFNEDNSQFKLIQSDEGFWYLPSALLDKVASIMQKSDLTANENSDSDQAPCVEIENSRLTNDSADLVSVLENNENLTVEHSDEGTSVQCVKDFKRYGRAYKLTIKSSTSKSVDNER